MDVVGMGGVDLIHTLAHNFFATDMGAVSAVLQWAYHIRSPSTTRMGIFSEEEVVEEEVAPLLASGHVTTGVGVGVEDKVPLVPTVEAAVREVPAAARGR